MSCRQDQIINLAIETGNDKLLKTEFDRIKMEENTTNNSGNKKSKITLYIRSHGTDIPGYEFNIDSSVRILSEAGKFGCYGFFVPGDSNIRFKISKFINDNKPDWGENSYLMLEDIKTRFVRDNINKKDTDKFLTNADKNDIANGNKSITIRQKSHTKKTIDLNEDWQIYTPILEHLYDFTDKTKEMQGIFIADMINKPSSFIFNVNTNLLKKILFEQHKIKIPDELKTTIIDESYLIKHFDFEEDEIEELIQNFSLLGIINLEDLALYLNDESLHNNLIDKDHLDVITTGIYSFYSKNKNVVMLSQIIKYLKKAGFEIINIIDKSCRAYKIIMTKDEIEKINRDELLASKLIDKTQGGKKQRKSRKKSHKKSIKKSIKKSHKKSRISK